jgi:rhodanese-related sulfurtransferase
LIERDIVLLDVREVDEYTGGHIDGSFNVPIRELPANLNLLPDLDAEIVVICQGGARAMLATASLKALGYSNVSNLAGGYGGWVAAEFPTTEDVIEVEAGEAPAFDEAVFAAVDGYLSNLPDGFGLVRAAALNEELVENPDILLIDTRSADEWNSGYIAGAQHIWIDEFMASMDEWPADKDAAIVIYCASSYRGGIATVMMNLMGYTNVRNLVGGLNAWVAEGLPLEGAPEAQESAEFDLTSYMASYVEGLPGSFNAIRVPELEEALASDDAPFLLDVRTVDEYTENHIEGAINVPLQELADNLDLLPGLDANIVIYCGSGHRSALAMTALNLLGYENAQSLLGGVGAWTNSDLPVTDVVTTAEAGEAPEIDPNILGPVSEYLAGIPAGYYIVRSDDLNVELAESDVVLLDVRTDGEFADGYIGGAVHLPLSQMFADVAGWPAADANIVIYDNPTHRSSMAMAMLQMLGYENVRTLGGGFGAWSNAGLPVETEG